MNNPFSQSPSTQSNRCPSGSLGDGRTPAQIAHDAAWERYHAAKSAHEADPYSVSILREYTEATKRLRIARDEAAKATRSEFTSVYELALGGV